MTPVCPCTQGVGLALPDTVPALPPPPPPPPPQLLVQGVAVGVSVGVGASVGPGFGVCELGMAPAASAPAGSVGGVAVGNFCPAASLPVPVSVETSAPPEPPAPKPARVALATVVRTPRQAHSIRIVSKPTTPETAARYCGLVSQRCWKPYTRLSSHDSRLIRSPAPHPLVLAATRACLPPRRAQAYPLYQHPRHERQSASGCWYFRLAARWLAQPRSDGPVYLRHRCRDAGRRADRAPARVRGCARAPRRVLCPRVLAAGAAASRRGRRARAARCQGWPACDPAARQRARRRPVRAGPRRLPPDARHLR